MLWDFVSIENGLPQFGPEYKTSRVCILCILSWFFCIPNRLCLVPRYFIFHPFSKFISYLYYLSPGLRIRGLGLQIWRLAANILNNQSWTVDQQWPSSLRIWRQANNLTLWKSSSFRKVTEGLETGLNRDYWRALVNAALNLGVP